MVVHRSEWLTTPCLILRAKQGTAVLKAGLVAQIVWIVWHTQFISSSSSLGIFSSCYCSLIDQLCSSCARTGSSTPSDVSQSASSLSRKSSEPTWPWGSRGTLHSGINSSGAGRTRQAWHSITAIPPISASQ